VDKLAYHNDTYMTPPHRPSFPARILPSFTFYSRLISIVFRASRLAKRGRYKTAEWCASSLETMRALEDVGVRVEISGVDSFRSLQGPCVFIGNHMSTLETFVLPAIISAFKDSTFVVKQSLVDYPVFKYVMRSRNPVTVGRSNPREDLKAVLDGGTERLRSGISIVIFPQTTRADAFDPAQFNTIGVKLAKKAGVPVVPVALRTDAWGNGKFLKDFGKISPEKLVYFAFGKPMMISDRGTEEHQAVIEFIERRLREWDRAGGGN
jgi:1-acyl-sn-glycerol-3-phosphate acyltransferase